MIRQCAWCACIIGQRAPLEDKSVTHGLCKRCQARVVRLHRSADPAHSESEALAAVSDGSGIRATSSALIET